VPGASALLFHYRAGSQRGRSGPHQVRIIAAPVAANDPAGPLHLRLLQQRVEMVRGKSLGLDPPLQVALLKGVRLYRDLRGVVGGEKEHEAIARREHAPENIGQGMVKRRIAVGHRRAPQVRCRDRPGDKYPSGTEQLRCFAEKFRRVVAVQGRRGRVGSINYNQIIPLRRRLHEKPAVDVHQAHPGLVKRLQGSGREIRPGRLDEHLVQFQVVNPLHGVLEHLTEHAAQAAADQQDTLRVLVLDHSQMGKSHRLLLFELPVRCIGPGDAENKVPALVKAVLVFTLYNSNGPVAGLVCFHELVLGGKILPLQPVGPLVDLIQEGEA